MEDSIHPLVERLPECLAEAQRHAAEHRGGEVARYIPELAKVDPELFAVAACTTGGKVAAAGDEGYELTLQSLSKPFVYGWALERFGVRAVHQRVGVEPTGDAFDSIIQLDQKNRAHNPMINAGAIAVTGLLAAGDDSERLSELLAKLSGFAGRELAGVDMPVYLSERSAGHRNRAIAYLLRHLGMLQAPVEQTLDLYFQQCAVQASCRDLAVMAATLANGGHNPANGERVLPERLVKHVLTMMFASGLYDFSGGFAVEVGLPAKSGVSGGLLAVVPGRLGLAAFSPRLDERGNTVRGMAAMRHLAEALELHLFEAPPAGAETEPRRRDPGTLRVETPRFDEPPPAMREVLESISDEVRGEAGGEVAGYIPPLAAASPSLFAVAACTIGGKERAVGDAEAPFTLQAAANPFGYGLAVEALGAEAVHRHVGVEPSDNPFNAIRFDPGGSKPMNPLGNAGAIAVCGLQPPRADRDADATDRLNRLLAGFAAFAGEPKLGIDAAVFLAEKRAGERNRAIASLLRNFGHLDDESQALELYFQQCSIRVTCRLLARMGAALANGGVQPRTGERVLSPEVVRRVLTLMYTCGLHDETGRFAFDVGLPAKTGISGAIVAVVPGRMGLAVYSPPVNRHGSSVRGILALKALSERLGLHVFDLGSGHP
jgi:glutaminase A